MVYLYYQPMKYECSLGVKLNLFFNETVHTVMNTWKASPMLSLMKNSNLAPDV